MGGSVTNHRPLTGVGKRGIAALVAVVLCVLVGGLSLAAAAQAANPVQLENQLPGTTDWRIGQPPYEISDDATGQIKGYASATSVDKGEDITFKVSVDSPQSYTIDVYRLGCYATSAGTCLGGRLIDHIGPVAGVHQPPCSLDSSTGLSECDWTGPTWHVPDTATSGVFVAVLTNAAKYQNYIPFVVRDDARHSALLYQEPVGTYQAYNNYPNYGSGDSRNGKSLYDSSSGGAETVAGPGRTRAVKVSFDRPYSSNGSGDLLDDNGWSWEGYFIRWAEQRGYDIAYSTTIDTSTHPERLLDHEGWITVGHDEYWSKQMYDGAAAARDAGVNLGFFGGNDVYWQVRFEASGSGTPNRVMVGYKNSPTNSYSTNDPTSDPSQLTVRFQDPPLNRPGQLLTGQTFLGSTERSDHNTALRPVNTSNWAFAGSGFADGDSVPGTVGYEVDRFDCQYPMPANQRYAFLAHSRFQDGDGYPGYSDSTVYEAPSGAQVFDAGTMSWSWALDRLGFTDQRVQKVTANLLDVLGGTTSAPAYASTPPDCSENRNFTFEGGSLTDPNPGPDATGGDKVLGTVGLDTTDPLDGAYSASLANVGNSYLDTHITATPDTDIALTLKLRALPTNDVRLMLAYAGVSPLGNLVVRPTGAVCVRYGNAWVGGTAATGCSSTPLAVGTSYRLRLHQVQGTGDDGVLEAFVAPAGTAFGAPFARMTNGAWVQKLDRFSVGATTATALDASFDDVTVAGTQLAVPATPTNATAVASKTETQVELGWSNPDARASSILIERSTDPSFANVTTLRAPAGSTSYTDTTVSTATSYHYRLRSANANGTSDPTPALEVTTRTQPPGAPDGLTIAWTAAGRNDLQWTPHSTDETAFLVERATDSSFSRGTTTITLPAGTSSYSDDNVPSGPAFYRVRAYTPSSTSAPSNVVSGPRYKDITFEGSNGALVDARTGGTSVVGAVSPDASTPLRGAHGMKVTAGNQYLDQTLPSMGDVFTSLYIRVDAKPAVDQRVVQVVNGGATVANLWIRVAGGPIQLCLKYGNNWSGPTSSVSTGCTPTTNPLVVGTTYRVGIVQRRGDGTSNASVQGLWSGNDPSLAPGETGPLSEWTSTTIAPSSSSYFTSAATAIRFGSTTSTAFSGSFDDVKVDAAYMPAATVLAPTSTASAPAYSSSPSLSVAYSATAATGGASLARVDLYAKGPGDLGYSIAGSDNQPQATGAIPYLAAGDGSYAFYTVATDSFGNTESSPAPPTTTIVDTQAPASQASSPPNVAAGTSAVTISYSASDVVSGSGLARVDLYARRPGESDFHKVATRADGAPTGTFEEPLGGTGLYAYYTVATDAAGNVEAAPGSPDTVTAVSDGSSPVSTVSGPASSTSRDLHLTYVASDDDLGSGLQTVELFAKGPGDADYAKVATDSSPGASGAFDVSVPGDGTYRFYSVATDAAGNREAAPGSADAIVVVDSAAPSSSASASGASSGPSIPVSFVSSDAGSGVQQVTLYVKAPGAADYASVASSTDSSGSFSYVPSAGDGTYRFYTRAQDVAGNVEDAPGAADATVVLDTTAPTSSASAPATAYSSPVTVGWTASDAGTGVARVDLYAKGPADSGYQKVATDGSPGAGGSFSYALSGGNGTYAFYTVAVDSVGNSEPAPSAADATTAFTVDSTAPSSAAAALPTYSATGSLAVGYSATDSGSGVAGVELWVKAPGAAGYVLAGQSNSANGSFAFTASQDGSYGFYTVATDRAGNREAAATTPDATTLVDTAAPAAFSLTDPANAYGFMAGSESLQVSPAPTDAGSGMATVRYEYQGSSGAWSTACTATAAPWTCTWNTTTVADGTYALRATAADRAGNARVAANAPLTGRRVDNTRPTARAVRTANVTGGTRGRPDKGDTLTFTFSEAVDPASVASGWNGSSRAVQVLFSDVKKTDRLEIRTSAGTTRLALANPLSLGGDYVGANTTYSATMVQNGSDVVVTLDTLLSGKLSGAVTGGTLSWSPDIAATDLAGNKVTNSSVSSAGPAF